jgi:hypothetical protein
MLKILAIPLLLTFVFFSAARSISDAQPLQTATKTDLRSPFRLLPGYKLKATPGLEGGEYATISMEGGASMEFARGEYRANAIDTIKKDQSLWREEQTIGENHFVCIYTRSHELVVTVFANRQPPADIRARIHSEKDMADVLLMVTTFDPQHGYSVDSPAVAPQQ